MTSSSVPRLQHSMNEHCSLDTFRDFSRLRQGFYSNVKTMATPSSSLSGSLSVQKILDQEYQKCSRRPWASFKLCFVPIFESIVCPSKISEWLKVRPVASYCTPSFCQLCQQTELLSALRKSSKLSVRRVLDSTRRQAWMQVHMGVGNLSWHSTVEFDFSSKLGFRSDKKFNFRSEKTSSAS